MSPRDTMQQMLEATRLTRDGRLGEAGAILKQVLGASLPGGLQPQSDLQPMSGLQPQPGVDAPRPGAARGSRVQVRPGASFTERRYADGHGERAYKLYVPSRYDGRAVPLVVMLHGCTQSPDDFAIGTRMNDVAESGTVLVAYPQQPKSANPSKCWNWFSERDQHRDSGEAALIAGITREVIRDYAVDPARVFAAGLSAGGAFAAIMGATYPDLFAAIGVHSGLACGAAHSLPSALAAMRKGSATAPVPANRAGRRAVRAIVFQGDADATVVARNADQVISQFAEPDASRSEIVEGVVPGGRSYTRETFIDATGGVLAEKWLVHGAAHAWAGGDPGGSYTDPKGPDASREMMRFFLA